MNKQNLPYYGALFLGWALYAYFSAVRQSVLVLLLLVPYGVIWFVALYGGLRLRTYVKTILRTPDGIGFARIDLGLFILLLALVLPAVLGSISGLYTSSPGLATSLTLLANYSDTILPFVAFAIIYVGTMNLTKLLKRTSLSFLYKSLFLIPLVVFTPLYFWLTFAVPNVTTTYHLPAVLIVGTILVPSLLAWVFGILASVNMGFYGREVQGVIYKRSVILLVRGVLALTLGDIIYLVLTSLGPYLIFLGTGVLLVLVYLFLGILGAGFIFVARGAERLTRLEGGPP
ncbi:MAG: hypothetical protein OK474_08530 [Thaumarchaeota archaeon]|nr:hypothetical protein [Nitrososphaerota archaeon]